MELRRRGHRLHAILYGCCLFSWFISKAFALDYSRLMYSLAIKIKIKYIFNVFTSKSESFPGLFLQLQHCECVWEDELISHLFSQRTILSIPFTITFYFVCMETGSHYADLADWAGPQLTLYARQALNLWWSSWPCLLTDWIVSMCHHAKPFAIFKRWILCHINI